MTDELIPFHDESGQERRNGTLMPPENFVSSFRTFESEHPVWEDADILRAIQDPNRVPGRVQFGSDWVQQQGQHGSCNGYAGAGSLAKARVRRGLPKLLLSGSFLYALVNRGRDAGSDPEDGMNAMQTHGIAPASLVTPDMIFPRLQPSTAAAEALKHRGLDCYAVQTKQGFRTALAAGFPVIVVVQAGKNFQKLNSQGINGVDVGNGDHATHVDSVEIIGGTEVYDMQNSWGLSFGQNGRCYCTWDSFAQTFDRFTFYSVASTEEAGE